MGNKSVMKLKKKDQMQSKKAKRKKNIQQREQFKTSAQ